MTFTSRTSYGPSPRARWKICRPFGAGQYHRSIITARSSRLNHGACHGIGTGTMVRLAATRQVPASRTNTADIRPVLGGSV